MHFQNVVFVTITEFVAKDGATGSYSVFHMNGLEIAREFVNHYEFEIDKSVRKATSEDMVHLNAILEKDENFRWRDFMSHFGDQW
jgi:hypothetical protein